MSGHTKGPWGIEQTDDTNWIGFMRPDGQKVELIVCTTARDCLTNDALERNDANARLIAAAPEMLEALRLADLVFRSLGYIAEADEGRPDSLGSTIKFAIAKATGGAG